MYPDAYLICWDVKHGLADAILEAFRICHFPARFQPLFMLLANLAKRPWPAACSLPQWCL